MRKDIETRRFTCKEVADQLSEIVRQKPDAELYVREGNYGHLVDSISYDPELNGVVIEICGV